MIGVQKHISNHFFVASPTKSLIVAESLVPRAIVDQRRTARVFSLSQLKNFELESKRQRAPERGDEEERVGQLLIGGFCGYSKNTFIVVES